MRVVPGFDVFEDRLAELLTSGPGSRVEQLALERCEEAFAEGVVVGGADAAHAAEQAGLAEAVSERPGRVLRATVGMDNCRAGLGASAPACDLECVDDEFGLEVVGDGEADDAARVDIDHDGRVDPALACGVLRDVGHPQPIRRVDSEDALDVIIVRGRRRLRSPESAPVRAFEAFFAHQPSDPLATDPDTTAESQLGLHARRTVRAARVGVNLLDLAQEIAIALCVI